MTSELPPTLSYAARLQHGVFSRRQALRAGLTVDLIRARVRRGTWRGVYPGVYTTSDGELSRLGAVWAVVLYAGRGAVLSHETAAELHGLADKVSADKHVTIPGDRRVIEVPGVRIHRSARVFLAASADDDPPRTNVEETVLDLVTAAATFDDVCGWVTRAISRELTDETRLRAAMDHRKKLRWRLELDELITAAVTGDHSVLEYRYTRDVERAHGLPEPDRQVPFTGPGRRRGRRDRVYREYAVVVELDGQQGHRAEDAWRDKRRDNAAAEVGQESLRYGWQDVRYRACATAVQVVKVLQNHGWEGQPRPCSIYCSVRYGSPG
jgi:hypothetical protein